MNVQRALGRMILTGKTEVPGEKPVPMLLCPPQISHGGHRMQTSEVTQRQLTA